MTSDSKDQRLIVFEEAFAAVESRLWVPEALFPRPTDPLTYQEGAMMWIRDHATLVHEMKSGYGFDRAELEAILQRVHPIKLGDAKHARAADSPIAFG